MERSYQMAPSRAAWPSSDAWRVQFRGAIRADANRANAHCQSFRSRAPWARSPRRRARDLSKTPDDSVGSRPP